jgi:hypothetical protein
MLTEICVDAVLAIKPTEEKMALDLHMVELMEMQHRSEQVRRHDKEQGCQIFLGATYQNGENIPNFQEIYQIVTKYIKWP